VLQYHINCSVFRKAIYEIFYVIKMCNVQSWYNVALGLRMTLVAWTCVILCCVGCSLSDEPITRSITNSILVTAELLVITKLSKYICILKWNNCYGNIYNFVYKLWMIYQRSSFSFPSVILFVSHRNTCIIPIFSITEYNWMINSTAISVGDIFHNELYIST
jgi:hypothetical protein